MNRETEKQIRPMVANIQKTELKRQSKTTKNGKKRGAKKNAQRRSPAEVQELKHKRFASRDDNLTEFAKAHNLSIHTTRGWKMEKQEFLAEANTKALEIMQDKLVEQKVGLQELVEEAIMLTIVRYIQSFRDGEIFDNFHTKAIDMLVKIHDSHMKDKRAISANENSDAVTNFIKRINISNEDGV